MKATPMKTAILICTLALAGCAGDGLVHVIDNSKPSSNVIVEKNPVAIRLGGYTDARNTGNPRMLGITTQPIHGVSKDQLLLDRDLNELVANAMRKRLEEAGFQLVDNDTAKFELTGTIKTLRYDVKLQDEISIEIETSVKEIASGKEVWSGTIKQSEKGFAGVSGSGLSDIAQNLKRELSIVTKKTVAALTANMTAFHPQQLVPVTAKSAISTGQFKLNVTPARAKVYVDGVYFGLSPLLASIDSGIHEITVKLEGYSSASEKISIRQGEITELEIALKR